MLSVKIREDFFEEEIISDYTVTKEMKQVWAVNLDLLENFQKLCEQNDLKYFAGFGTLLGAVRHQGFIPWDDDIDLLMPRADFEKLKTLTAAIKDPYYLQTPEKDPGFWHRGMIKFRRSDTTCIEKHSFYAEFNQGIGLEILPLDHCPENLHVRKKTFEKVGFYQKLLWAKFFKHDYQCTEVSALNHFRGISPWKWKLYRLIAFFCKKSFLKKFLYETYQYSNGMDSNRYTMYISYNKDDEYKTFYKEDFSSSLLFSFEHLQIPVPKGFQRCLEIQYGKSFLTYLPTKDREPHHPALWDVEESYLLYRNRFQKIFSNAKGKKVIIFGTGNMVNHYLKNVAAEYIPDFYVDNNPQKWDTYIGDKMVKNPQVLKEFPSESLHIIICNNYFREIGKQLRDMGIFNYYIYTDNFNGLFTTPNEISKFDTRKKSYKLGYYVIDGFDQLAEDLLLGLEKAKEECSRLVVAINSVSINGETLIEDLEFIKIKKILSMIKYVDHVSKINVYNIKEAQEKYLFDRLFILDKFHGNLMDFNMEVHITELKGFNE